MVDNSPIEPDEEAGNREISLPSLTALLNEMRAVTPVEEADAANDSGTIMKKTTPSRHFSWIGACVLVGIFSTANAQYSRTVFLQGTTPGVSQTGHITIDGVSIAGFFSGNGSLLTDLNASSVTSGTLPLGRLPSQVARLDLAQTFTGANSFTNILNVFAGNGSLLSNLNAANFSAGTVADARLSSNIARLSTTQTFTGAKTFSNAANVFAGNGSGLTNIPWAAITGAPNFGQLAGANTWTGSNMFQNPLNEFAGNGAGLTNLQWSSFSNLSSLLNSNRTWTGVNEFTNPLNQFRGNGAGLTQLNASNISSGTLADARLSANVALLNRNQTFTGENVFNGATALLGNVGIGTAAGVHPLTFAAGNGRKILFNGPVDDFGFSVTGSNLEMTSSSTGKIEFGQKTNTLFTPWLSIEDDRATLTGRMSASTFTMTTGAADFKALIGNSTGDATWGVMNNRHLESDGNSLEKVTGGYFRMSGNSMYGINGSGIQLFGNNARKVLIDPSSVTEAGEIKLYGFNGNANVALTSTSNGNRGYVGVADSTGTFRAGFQIDGNGDGQLWASLKNFIVPDPTNPELDIVYACIEGPEAAMYTRGTGSLVNGKAVLSLPDHFVKLANLETATVHVTPLDDCNGLFVRKENGQIRIVEFGGGKSNIDFDWEIKCVRQGFEDYQVVRPWTHIQPAGDREQQWQNRMASIRATQTNRANRASR